MNAFDRLNSREEFDPRKVTSQSGEIDKVADATKKMKGVMKTLSMMDNKVQELRKGYEESKDPDLLKRIDHVRQSRSALTQKLANPKMFSVAAISSIPNSELFLKTVDPVEYEMLSDKQKSQIQQRAAELDQNPEVRSSIMNSLEEGM
jgi:hypothetical protein